jgi:signal peptidase I
VTGLHPWLAAALSMLVPGLGQAAAGRPVRGLAWLLASMGALAGFLWWVLGPVRANPVEGGAWLVAIGVAEFGSWIDAWLVARRALVSPSAPRSPEGALALSLFFPGLGHAYLYARRWWLLPPLALGWCAPGLLLTAILALEEPPVPWWPAWALHWPGWAAFLASAGLSAGAAVHAWWLGCRRAGRSGQWPGLRAGWFAIALAAWGLAQLPWEGWLKDHLVRSFKIPSASMEPTLVEGDRLWARRTTSLARGEIVVFRPPDRPEEDYIKRVVGLPGDRLEIRRQRVFLNGAPLEEPYAVHRSPGRRLAGVDDLSPVTVPPGCYFVMGDNRDNSRDSRYFRFVPAGLVYGRAYKRYWPPHRVGPLR